MPARYWIIAIVFGLAATLGQAQDAGQSADRQSEAQQPPPQTLPIPIPVEIVEDEAEAEARQSREQIASQREKDDLAAQQGMNTATQAMNEATQRMADDSREMTIATWVGVFLLFVTLLLTLQANRAAVKAVKVTETFGIAENRPYVQATLGGPVSHRNEVDQSIFWRIKLVLSNSGSTPTKSLSVKSAWQVIDAQEANTELLASAKPVRGYIRGGASYVTMFVNISGQDLSSVKYGEKALFVFVEAIYGTALDNTKTFITRQGFRATDITGDPCEYWNIEKNPVHVEWQHIPNFYCFDEECDD